MYDHAPETPAVPIDQRRRAEQAVLGAMLRDRLCIPDVVRVLRRATMFGLYHHQLIFDAIISLHADARPIDLVTVCELLVQRHQLDDVGKYVYLAELLKAAPSSSNVEYHAGLVLNHHLLSQGAQLAEELGRDTRSPSCPAGELLADYDRRIMRLVEDSTTNEPQTLQVALDQQLATINARSTRGDASGTLTHYTDLDRIIVGLQPGELIAIAARPSVGKTALGACIASNIARAGGSVLFSSLEQSSGEIVERLLAKEAVVDSYRLRTGKLTGVDSDGLIQAQAAMAKWRFHIDDTPNQTVTSIAATARRISRRHGLDVLFVDYLQLITPDNPRANRYEQVGVVTRRLKQLARDLQIPVVVMCQVGRDAGDGDEGSPPPKLHQLRESGNIEQDLDVAILLHREQSGDATSGKAEVIRVDVAKNRNGRRGLLMLGYRPQFLRFENHDHGVAY